MSANTILIPYHHRIDLLLPLLQHLKNFPILVVDDGPKLSDWNQWSEYHSTVQCIRAEGSSGFTKAVNKGLEYLESRGVKSVLILNDDAWIDPEAVQDLFSKMDSKKIISPVIQVEDIHYYGVVVSRTGRVKLQIDSSKSVNALLGPCLCIPSNLRFDTRYIHGFEDIALTYWAYNQGYDLKVLEDHCCVHQQGGTVHPLSSKGVKNSIYGHLQLYDSLLRMPFVWVTYVALLAKNGGQESRFKLFNSMNQGAVDWFWSAIAVRMASSKLGSNKAK